MRLLLTICCLLILLTHSHAQSKAISALAEKFIKDPSLKGAIAGISILNEEDGSFMYQKNAETYLIPASNTKIFTLYAALKYIGDSLPGMYVKEYADQIVLFPTGDPTLLHPGFSSQPVVNFIKSSSKKILVSPSIQLVSEPWGAGWCVDDISESFMPERSALPVFGNLFTYGSKQIDADISALFRITNTANPQMEGKRMIHENNFYQIKNSSLQKKSYQTPFITSLDLAVKILALKSGRTISLAENETSLDSPVLKEYFIRSRPLDSMLIPMMHESDNFFAEQSLLMVEFIRNKKLDEQALIEYLLKNDLSQIPQKPNWIDGSGLSRYNLFTTNDFIFILRKLKANFGEDRIRRIFPKGGEGTLKNYFIAKEPFIYAKTGTVSNNCSLSGFLTTKSGKKLVFSIILNHYPGKATPVKQALEQFLLGIRDSI